MHGCIFLHYIQTVLFSYIHTAIAAVVVIATAAIKKTATRTTLQYKKPQKQKKNQHKRITML